MLSSSIKQKFLAIVAMSLILTGAFAIINPEKEASDASYISSAKAEEMYPKVQTYDPLTGEVKDATINTPGGVWIDNNNIYLGIPTIVQSNKNSITVDVDVQFANGYYLLPMDSGVGSGNGIYINDLSNSTPISKIDSTNKPEVITNNMHDSTDGVVKYRLTSTGYPTGYKYTSTSVNMAVRKEGQDSVYKYVKVSVPEWATADSPVINKFKVEATSGVEMKASWEIDPNGNILPPIDLDGFGPIELYELPPVKGNSEEARAEGEEEPIATFTNTSEPGYVFSTSAGQHRYKLKVKWETTTSNGLYQSTIEKELTASTAAIPAKPKVNYLDYKLTDDKDPSKGYTVEASVQTTNGSGESLIEIAPFPKPAYLYDIYKPSRRYKMPRWYSQPSSGNTYGFINDGLVGDDNAADDMTLFSEGGTFALEFYDTKGGKYSSDDKNSVSHAPGTDGTVKIKGQADAPDVYNITINNVSDTTAMMKYIVAGSVAETSTMYGTTLDSLVLKDADGTKLADLDKKQGSNAQTIDLPDPEKIYKGAYIEVEWTSTNGVYSGKSKVNVPAFSNEEKPAALEPIVNIGTKETEQTTADISYELSLPKDPANIETVVSSISISGTDIEEDMSNVTFSKNPESTGNHNVKIEGLEGGRTYTDWNLEVIWNRGQITKYPIGDVTTKPKDEAEIVIPRANSLPVDKNSTLIEWTVPVITESDTNLPTEVISAKLTGTGVSPTGELELDVTPKANGSVGGTVKITDLTSTKTYDDWSIETITNAGPASSSINAFKTGGKSPAQTPYITIDENYKKGPTSVTVDYTVDWPNGSATQYATEITEIGLFEQTGLEEDGTTPIYTEIPTTEPIELTEGTHSFTVNNLTANTDYGWVFKYSGNWGPSEEVTPIIITTGDKNKPAWPDFTVDDITADDIKPDKVYIHYNIENEPETESSYPTIFESIELYTNGIGNVEMPDDPYSDGKHTITVSGLESETEYSDYSGSDMWKLKAKGNWGINLELSILPFKTIEKYQAPAASLSASVITKNQNTAIVEWTATPQLETSDTKGAVVDSVSISGTGIGDIDVPMTVDPDTGVATGRQTIHGLSANTTYKDWKVTAVSNTTVNTSPNTTVFEIPKFSTSKKEDPIAPSIENLQLRTEQVDNEDPSKRYNRAIIDFYLIEPQENEYTYGTDIKEVSITGTDIKNNQSNVEGIKDVHPGQNQIIVNNIVGNQKYKDWKLHINWNDGSMLGGDVVVKVPEFTVLDRNPGGAPTITVDEINPGQLTTNITYTVDPPQKDAITYGTRVKAMKLTGTGLPEDGKELDVNGKDGITVKETRTVTVDNLTAGTKYNDWVIISDYGDGINEDRVETPVGEFFTQSKDVAWAPTADVTATVIDQVSTQIDVSINAPSETSTVFGTEVYSATLTGTGIAEPVDIELTLDESDGLIKGSTIIEDLTAEEVYSDWKLTIESNSMVGITTVRVRPFQTEAKKLNSKTASAIFASSWSTTPSTASLNIELVAPEGDAKTQDVTITEATVTGDAFDDKELEPNGDLQKIIVGNLTNNTTYGNNKLTIKTEGSETNEVVLDLPDIVTTDKSEAQTPVIESVKVRNTTTSSADIEYQISIPEANEFTEETVIEEIYVKVGLKKFSAVDLSTEGTIHVDGLSLGEVNKAKLVVVSNSSVDATEEIEIPTLDKTVKSNNLDSVEAGVATFSIDPTYEVADPDTDLNVSITYTADGIESTSAAVYSEAMTRSSGALIYTAGGFSAGVLYENIMIKVNDEEPVAMLMDGYVIESITPDEEGNAKEESGEISLGRPEEPEIPTEPETPDPIEPEVLDPEVIKNGAPIWAIILIVIIIIGIIGEAAFAGLLFMKKSKGNEPKKESKPTTQQKQEEDKPEQSE